MSGWIKLHRKMSKWEWASDSNTFSLAIHFLLDASHEETKVKGIKLEAGQLIYGRKKWSAKTGLSEQNLRTCINRLIESDFLTSKSTNKYTIVTIEKWDEYQMKEEKSTSKLTNHQPATNHIQECKEEIYKDYIYYKKGNLLQRDFIPPDEWLDIALQHGFALGEASKHFQIFKNWHIANEVSYADWTAAWEVWLIKQKDKR
jgi:hypothetical protein